MIDKELVSFPKNETVWEQIIYNHAQYLVTSKSKDRTWYFLYKIVDGKPQRVSKDKNPNKLRELIK